LKVFDKFLNLILTNGQEPHGRLVLFPLSKSCMICGWLHSILNMVNIIMLSHSFIPCRFFADEINATFYL